MAINISMRKIPKQISNITEAEIQTGLETRGTYETIFFFLILEIILQLIIRTHSKSTSRSGKRKHNLH